MAKIKFGPDTDYGQALNITQLIFGDVTARGDDCCTNKKQNADICTVTAKISAAQYALSVSDTPRYQKAVKVAYLTIYPYANKDYNP